MSASATRTASASAADTYADVVSVTRKLRADLLQVLDHYGYFSDDFGESIVHDLRLMIDEGIVDWAELSWTRSKTSTVPLAAFRYKVVNGDAGLADDRPGGIPYRPDLVGVYFTVRVQYNAVGQRMSAAAKQGLGLKLQWSPGALLNYGGGSWSSDRSYASNNVGLRRTSYG